MPTLPCIVYGRVISTTRVVGNIKVNFMNMTTGESMQRTTDDVGNYTFDCQNYLYSYTIGDTIKVSLYEDRAVYDNNVDVSNGRIELI